MSKNEKTTNKIGFLDFYPWRDLVNTITREWIIQYKNEYAINLFVIDVAIVKLASLIPTCSLNEQKLNWVFEKGLRSRIVILVTNKLITQSSKSSNLFFSYRVHQLRIGIFYFKYFLIKFHTNIVYCMYFLMLFLRILLRSCMHGPNQKFGSIRISVFATSKKSIKINDINDVKNIYFL